MTLHLFPELGTLKRRNENYSRIHADLTLTYLEEKKATLTKQERGELKNTIYRKTGETQAV
jgi:hypothetical protein